MRLRRKGHHRRRAGGDPAKRSCRLAGLLPRVRRTSVRDSSQSDGQLSQQAEAACGVDGAPPRSRRRRFGRYIPGTVLFTLRAALSETPCLLGATGRASTQRGLHQGKAKVRKDAERSAANQNGCERFDAQLADCRIDRRGATMVTRTTPPLLVRSEHAAAGRHVAVVVVYRTPGPGGAAHPADAGGFIVDRQSPGSIPVLLVTGCDNAFGMNALGFPS